MKHFTVSGRDVHERLDKYLVKQIDRISRHGAKGLIDAGRVKVNGRRVVIAKWELLEGDDVEVRVEGLRSKPLQEERQELKGPKGFVAVIFEDRDVMVVDKPAGAVVQLGESADHGHTYVDSLRAYIKRKYRGKGAYVRAVHRLDKETSGLMVFAKSRVGDRLVDQFKKHTVGRAYLAVVDGAVDGENGRVELPIKKGEFGHGKRAGVDRSGEGSKALTLYSVRERYKKATYLELILKTGRTHQARVHMAAIGHPIVGDKLYGRQDGINFGRQALHSYRLIFSHPATGKKMDFSLKLPEDMEGLIDELRG